jgi:hypothetical protein
MSSVSPEPGVLVPLTVTSADECSQILIVDGDMNLRARGQGSLHVSLPPGIYKIRVRSGTALEEELVVLQKDSPVTRAFDHLPFASPVPLDRTARTHEYQQQLAVEASRRVRVAHWAGPRPAWIFVMARDWTDPDHPMPDLRRGHPNPAHGMLLCDADGRVVADLDARSEVRLPGSPGQDACAACNVRVRPGIYQLCRTARRTPVAQTVVAAEGWQTQVFLLHRGTGEEPLAATSIHMSRDRTNPAELPGFDPGSPGLRRFELARLGLVDERQVLPDDIIDEILGGKFEDPMLGILGAHLLLLKAHGEEEVRRVEQSLPGILGNLRALLGPEHPDVEALALRLRGADGNFVFRHPPMLRRSWPLVLEATVEKPELVPADSLAARVSDRFLTDAPWLIWAEPGTSAEGGGTGLESTGGETGGRVEALFDQLHPPTRDLDPELFSAHSAFGLPMAKGVGFESAGGHDEGEIRRLVRVLGVPRRKVEQLLKRRREEG